MPRRNLDEHFAGPRPEWTRRKHELLARYVVAAAMKMRLRGRLVLVDGYAGANKYGDEPTGSTVIMVEAARRVISQGSSAVVYACEPNAGRFAQLASNLSNECSSGLLVPMQMTHREALAKILPDISGMPAIVFLDPQTVTQMTLEGDVLPWARRPRTDVLGVFMLGQACRCCSQFQKGLTNQMHPQEYLGLGWQRGASEAGALSAFISSLGSYKRFVGNYILRKKLNSRKAYSIFGLSDHPDGYWLLSNAVAKDYSLLKDFDYQAEAVDNLFAQVDRDEAKSNAFAKLISLAEPIIRSDPALRGAGLASRMFERGIGVNELFGRYVESDFTDARNKVLGLPSRRRNRAKED